MDIKERLAELSEEEKKYLLEKIKQSKQLQSQKEKEEHVWNRDEITTAEEKEYYPLSSAQKRIYLAQQLDTTKISYNIPSIALVVGQLERDKAEKALKKLIEKHEILRTSFHMLKDELVQKVHPMAEVECAIDYKMYDGVFHKKMEKETLDRLMKSFMKPFDLENAPLIHVTIVSDKEGNNVLLTDVHHIIADGSSINILINDFIQAYQEGKIKPLEIQYKDYAEWHNKFLQSKDIKKQEEFWLKELGDNIPVLELPYDFSRPKEKIFDGAKKIFLLDKKYVDKLEKLQKKYHTTAFMMLVTLVNILLSKYSGQEEIVIGTPIAGRHYKKLDQLIGMFANTMALKNYPKADMTFEELLTEVTTRTIECFENQDYPFDDLVMKTKVKRDAGRNPIFDVMLILQNMHSEIMKIDGLDFIPFEWDDETSKFDLLFEVFQTKEGMLFRIEYASKLFLPETIDRMWEHFIVLINQVTENEKIKLGEVVLLTENEKRQLDEYNNTIVDFDKNSCLHQLFEKQVEQTPDRIALKMRNDNMTYRELNEKANVLANAIAEKGVKMTGILLKPSFDVVITMLAVWKAGSAYMLIDNNLPKARIEFMLKDGDVELIITNKELVEELNIECEAFYIEDIDYEMGTRQNLERDCDSHDLAYIVYTSGSTGKPKGVLIEHLTLCNLFQGFIDRMEFIEEKTIIALSTVSFDVFIIETILPLTRGMHVVIADELEKTDMKKLNELMYQNHVEMLQCTPTRLEMFFHSGNEPIGIKNLKDIMVGGEALTSGLVSKIQDVSKARIHNLYGLTEITVWSMEKRVEDKNNINIGTPIANTKVYILDHNYKMQPIGVIGELFLAGAGMPRGYHKREELNKAKFIQNPYDKGEKMFSTGDLARWNADGEVELFGRRDFQVKIRGNRIEIEEIENCLKQCEGIDEVVVILRKDDNNPRLYCYLKGTQQFDVSDMKRYLEERLPKYMVPSFFVKIDSFPYTTSGKIDRIALAKIEGAVQKEEGYRAPCTKTEQVIAQVWEEVLGVEHVGVRDDFFDVGGNSLLGIKLQVELLKKNCWVEGTNLYQFKTIEEQAAHYDRNNQKEKDCLQNKTDHRVLEGIVPFNQFKAFQEDLSNMVCHTTQFFSFDVENFLLASKALFHYSDHKLEVERKHIGNWEDIWSEAGIKVEKEKSFQGNFTEIVRYINDNCPIILSSMKNEITKYMMIYGYHYENKTVSTIMSDDMSKRYIKKEYDFEQIRNGYQQGFVSGEIYCIRKNEGGKERSPEEIYYENQLSKEQAKDNLKVLEEFINDVIHIMDSQVVFMKEHEKIESSLQTILDCFKTEIRKAEYCSMKDLDVLKQMMLVKNHFTDIRETIVQCALFHQYDHNEQLELTKKLELGSEILKEFYKTKADV